jgi:hypothetical protein
VGYPLPMRKGLTMDILTKTALGFAAALMAMTIGQWRHPQPMPVKAPQTTFLAPYSVANPQPVVTYPQYAKTTNCGQVRELAIAAGLPLIEVQTAVKVARRESRCFSDAYNPNDTYGRSYSIYQINSFWCEPSKYWPNGWLQAKGVLETCNDLFDPLISSNAMVAIWRNSGWLPWSTAN